MVNSGLMDRLLLSNFRLQLASFAVSATFVVLLCFLFELRWETNDDIAMSMVAHGYGIASIGSPNIVFSNVVWGYLVRLLPEINGILGYSLATLGTLIVVSTVIVYGLCRLGVGYVVSFSVLVLILTRPVLVPQFTINAGLLMVAAILCWILFVQKNDKQALVMGCILAFCSFLVRSDEFYLVLIIASPVLPWRALWLHHSSKIAFFALILAIAGSAIINHQAYQGPEWKDYNELNPARKPITDFGFDRHLKQHPEILQEYGYSPNDIGLIRSWFFIDPAIANPIILKEMIDKLGFMPNEKKALANAWIALSVLYNFKLLPLILAAFLLALLRPSWKIAASWGLCIAAIVGIGILGRPGVLRIQIPLFSFLLIAPLFEGKITGWRRLIQSGIIFVAAAVNFDTVCAESKWHQPRAEKMRFQFAGFPNSPIVVWGAALPYEALFPVIRTSGSMAYSQIYGLGCFTLAPFSIHSTEKQAGRSAIDLLLRGNDLLVIANEIAFNQFNIYAKERLHGKLNVVSVQRYGKTPVRRVRFEKENDIQHKEALIK